MPADRRRPLGCSPVPIAIAIVAALIAVTSPLRACPALTTSSAAASVGKHGEQNDGQW